MEKSETVVRRRGRKKTETGEDGGDGNFGRDKTETVVD